MARVNTATDGLPSLPQALIPVLDATQADEADFQSLARAIMQDGAMASRLLQAANSAFYYRGSPCRTIDRALFSLGLDTVRSLALTAAIQQLFGTFGPRHRNYLRIIWRRALTTANLAQVLATLTRYPRPEEAYLAGLLIDIGRLLRLVEDEGHYWPLLQTATNDPHLVEIECNTYGQHYGELGGECLEVWGLGRFVADAVRYHLEPAERVRDAHHLVKIVNLAHALGCLPATLSSTAETTCNETALAAADTLFGLNEGLVRELRGRVDEDVRRIAGSLEIDLEAPEPPPEAEAESADRAAEQALGRRVRDLTELERVNGELARAASLQERCLAARRTLYLTLGVSQSLLFLVDDDQQSVSAWVEDDETPDFTLPLLPGRSLVTDTLLDREIRRHEEENAAGLPVIDQQLFRLCEAQLLWSFPLLAEGQKAAGVLILGLSRSQADALEARNDFIRSLAREIARALTQPEYSSAGPADHTEERIRETVHEAGNPLSIIQNYLGVLNRKLGEEHDARHELGLIKDEIDRVGRILLRLRDPEAGPADDTGPMALNTLVRQVADIVDVSLCRTRGIQLHLDLTPAEPPLSIPADHLRQILTNLLKNAAEAQNSGGEITITTRAPTTLNGRRVVPLTVSDKGPGLPPEVQAAAFSPVTSTKGTSHSGLGLSIVKRLTEEIGAGLTFTSTGAGTRFEITLPHQQPGSADASGTTQ
ncbi:MULTISPECIES: HDOD domain-containing protein [unclassified Thioalkalivibrio]|uniref:HDOD domain-containing protein n=1 Tax=unclassified Thioalkalivibrio TaxID=2621013 RepID=UPI00039D0577|nr:MULTISPECIES: HDOD domain-containing protein [unclassified Thioalkalivibrio]